MMKKETELSEHTNLFDIGHKNQDIAIRLQICSKKLHYAFEKWIIESKLLLDSRSNLTK